MKDFQLYYAINLKESQENHIFLLKKRKLYGIMKHKELSYGGILIKWNMEIKSFFVAR
jgi:hypothetical protein